MAPLGGSTEGAMCPTASFKLGFVSRQSFPEAFVMLWLRRTQYAWKWPVEGGNYITSYNGRLARSWLVTKKKHAIKENGMRNEEFWRPLPVLLFCIVWPEIHYHTFLGLNFYICFLILSFVNTHKNRK